MCKLSASKGQNPDGEIVFDKNLSLKKMDGDHEGDASGNKNEFQGPFSAIARDQWHHLGPLKWQFWLQIGEFVWKKRFCL